MGGYRNEEHCIAGFNLVVIDVDDGVSIDTANLLLKEYQYLIYTTKRHTDTHNRFRIIFPLTHILKLDAVDFKEFMNNIYDWLPFECDRQTGQRSRKWLTHNGKYAYNQGKMLDALLFIPKTKKSEERKIILNDLQSLNNLERWFAQQCTDNMGRNNSILKYAFMLADSNIALQDIRSRIIDFNKKLPEPLPETEIDKTIMISVANKINKQAHV